MNQPKIPPVILACFLALALLAGYGVRQRMAEEKQNRSVCIATESDVINDLAASQNVPFDQALDQLRIEGLRGVVLSEETVGSWIGAGRLKVTTLSDPSNPGRLIPVLTGNSADISTVESAIEARFKGGGGNLSADKTTLQFPNLTPGLLRTVSLGIDPFLSQVVISHRLIVIARLSNPVGINSEGVAGTISLAKTRGATVFLPQGDQVLGRRDAFKALTDSLALNNMLYASPEFSKMGGDEEVLKSSPELVVRLHSAQIAELDKLTLGAAVERYTKAARERNMRILLVRPFDSAAALPLKNFGGFVNKIAKVIVKQGQVLGNPHPFTEPKTRRFFYPILGLSILPLIGWLCWTFIPLATIPALGIGLIFSLEALSPTHRNPIAFLIALTVPIFTFVSIDCYSTKSIIWAYLRTSLISLVGGLAVAAMLSQLRYYVRAEEFQGVKLAVFAPILIALGYYLHKYGSLSKLMSEPISVRNLIFGFVLLGIFGYMFLRTGNDNPTSVSPLEIVMRQALDRFLFVRPRTKSFLIGLPAMFIAINMYALLKKGNRTTESTFGAWTALAITAGMISQTDIVNTFCHIHTPVTLSLIRIFIELIIGGVIGFIGWKIIEYFLPKELLLQGKVAKMETETA